MATVKEYLEKINAVIANGEFKDNWESLSKFKTPGWYQAGRFGIFIHWGCYSVAACQSEWYPRLMYLPKEKSCKHKNETYGKNFEYRQLVEKFNPDRYNADEWAALFKMSGAKYVMPVGEHHDGIKMYESDLNRWNMAALPPHRDFCRELHEACDRQGLGFLISSHRAEHYWFMNGARKYFPDSEALGEEYRDLYGPCALTPGGSINHDDITLTATTEWLEDWLASSCEMVDKNKPLGVFFDWWIQKPEFRPYMKKFLAYYYNCAKEWGFEPAVFYKWGSAMKDCAIFDVERGQIDGISTNLWQCDVAKSKWPEVKEIDGISTNLWQCDTAIAKNSWSYTDGNEFKTPYEVITNLIDVVSKNGCLMLNVGPKADGTICEEEKNVLLQIGEWMKCNGEAIYDCHPFDVYGEGKQKSYGSFKEDIQYSIEDYRFTYRAGSIYVFPMSAKARDRFEIKRLKFGNEGSIRYEIKGIELLGQNTNVVWKQDEHSLIIKTEKTVCADLPLCFKISID